ncbi:hypothetical protein L2E82_32996 [Cichorium intybus]|uniref:Uncharacterized protein n=1 Tax=Cichorium intybus TaxID=13427 RepID=A0ACB9BJ54_CICIN|nr:hypothetical protein L2E82_32996 [Cichorium intybus]
MLLPILASGKQMKVQQPTAIGLFFSISLQNRHTTPQDLVGFSSSLYLSRNLGSKPSKTRSLITHRKTHAGASFNNPLWETRKMLALYMGIMLYQRNVKRNHRCFPRSTPPSTIHQKEQPPSSTDNNYRLLCDGDIRWDIMQGLTSSILVK